MYFYLNSGSKGVKIGHDRHKEKGDDPTEEKELKIIHWGNWQRVPHSQ